MATAIAPETERVIRRFVPVITDLKPLLARGDLLGIAMDCEATDKDSAKASIIELALVPFAFTANGAVTGIGQAQSWYEDPGIDIPAEVTKITGITNEMVHRKRIDDGAVNELVANAAIVIAHNSEYDRRVSEKRCSVFKHVRWGCTLVDPAWRDEGYECGKLRCVFLEHCNLDFENHGAVMDAYAVAHLLTTTLPSGLRTLHCVLDNARQSHVRIYAVGSPFAYKDLLKERGYKFDAPTKTWHRDVLAGDAFQLERTWLAENAMCHSPTWSQFDARQRFSDRIGKG